LEIEKCFYVYTRLEAFEVLVTVPVERDEVSAYGSRGHLASLAQRGDVMVLEEVKVVYIHDVVGKDGEGTTIECETV